MLGWRTQPVAVMATKAPSSSPRARTRKELGVEGDICEPKPTRPGPRLKGSFRALFARPGGSVSPHRRRHMEWIGEFVAARAGHSCAGVGERRHRERLPGGVDALRRAHVIAPVAVVIREQIRGAAARADGPVGGCEAR